MKSIISAYALLTLATQGRKGDFDQLDRQHHNIPRKLQDRLFHPMVSTSGSNSRNFRDRSDFNLNRREENRVSGGGPRIFRDRGFDHANRREEKREILNINTGDYGYDQIQDRSYKHRYGGSENGQDWVTKDGSKDIWNRRGEYFDDTNGVYRVGLEQPEERDVYLKRSESERNEERKDSFNRNDAWVTKRRGFDLDRRSESERIFDDDLGRVKVGYYEHKDYSNRRGETEKGFDDGFNDGFKREDWKDSLRSSIDDGERRSESERGKVHKNHPGEAYHVEEDLMVDPMMMMSLMNGGKHYGNRRAETEAEGERMALRYNLGDNVDDVILKRRAEAEAEKRKIELRGSEFDVADDNGVDFMTMPMLMEGGRKGNNRRAESEAEEEKIGIALNMDHDLQGKILKRYRDDGFFNRRRSEEDDFLFFSDHRGGNQRLGDKDDSLRMDQENPFSRREEEERLPRPELREIRKIERRKEDEGEGLPAPMIPRNQQDLE